MYIEEDEIKNWIGKNLSAFLVFKYHDVLPDFMENRIIPI